MPSSFSDDISCVIQYVVDSKREDVMYSCNVSLDTWLTPASSHVASGTCDTGDIAIGLFVFMVIGFIVGMVSVVCYLKGAFDHGD